MLRCYEYISGRAIYRNAKAKRLYMLTLQVSIYCLLALHGIIGRHSLIFVDSQDPINLISSQPYEPQEIAKVLENLF